MRLNISQSYTIKQGDWLSKIAREILVREGDTDITADEIYSYSMDIARHNNVDVNRIFAGQELDLSPWLNPDGIALSTQTIPVTPQIIQQFSPGQVIEMLAQRIPELFSTTAPGDIIELEKPIPPEVTKSNTPASQAETIDVTDTPTPDKADAETMAAQQTNIAPRVNTPVQTLPSNPISAPTFEKPLQKMPTPTPVAAKTTPPQATIATNANIISADQLPKDQRTIVFITGHGGIGETKSGYGDPGAVGADNITTERELAVYTTQRQIALLKSYGYNVIEVETTNVNGKPSLDEQRYLKALYPNTPIIHNHYNSLEKDNPSRTTVSGSEVYYATSGGHDLAQSIQAELNDVSREHGYNANRSHQYNDYRVLKPIDMDGDGDVDEVDKAIDNTVLIEYDYICNGKVLEDLKQGASSQDPDGYLNQKADAAAAGITQFMHQRYQENQLQLS